MQTAEENCSGVPERRGSRVDWVDILKGLSLCSVYIAHTQHAGAIFPFIMLFTIQCFFFTSGFFTEKHVFEPFLSSLAVRFKKLMIPYLIFSVATYAFSLCDALPMRPNLEVLPNAVKILLGIREHTMAPALWFFPCLFLADVMYVALRRAAAKLVPNHPFAFVLPVALLISLAGTAIRYRMKFFEPWPHASFGLPWNPSWAMEYLVFFALGAALFPRLRDFHWRTASWPVRAFAGSVWLAAVWISVSVLVGFEPWRTFGVALYGFPILPMFFLRTAYTVIILLALTGAAKMIGPRSPILAKIGSKTLVLCGSEVLSVILLGNVCAIFQLRPALPFSLLHAILWAMLTLLIAYRFFVPFFERLFPVWCGNSR